MHASRSAIVPQWLVRRRLPGDEPRVLLTFDDGPSDITAGVLGMLQTFDARAVFFVVGGRIPRVPEALPAILAAGHQLGNHTYHHRDRDVLRDQRPSSFRDYYADVERCQREIVSRTGFLPRWFRPPGGRVNFNSLVVPRLQHMATMNWRRDINDWKFRTAAEGRAGGQQLADAIRPGDIVLLHDERRCLLDLLDALLGRLQKSGFDLRSGIDAI